MVRRAPSNDSLSDIKFVWPHRLCALVEAMLDRDLWVVWSGFSLLGNAQGKASESAKLQGR
jgi:hypothetical protein